MEMASPLEPKWALMHCLFPLMLTINMNGLGAAVIIIYKKSFFGAVCECLWRGALTVGEQRAPIDLSTDFNVRKSLCTLF